MEFFVQTFNNIISVFKTIQVKDVIDIIIISLVIFGIFKLVKETRAEQLLKGVLILVVLYIVSTIFNLTMMQSLMRIFLEFGVLLIAIIFQPEIRKALEKLGRVMLRKKYLSFLLGSGVADIDVKATRKAISDVAEVCEYFSAEKTGALIIFERNVKLTDIAESGTVLNSEPSVALLGNIFFNKAPLHDGATIIRDGLVYCCGCILPLTKNTSIDINLGTRHRAALGVSEVSDAMVVVVSEETGNISIALNGVLTRDYDKQSLITTLENYLLINKKNFSSNEKEEDKDE